MLVDYERAFLDLKARLIEKRSWGLRELMVLLAEVELASQVDAEGIDPTPSKPHGNGHRVPTTGCSSTSD